MEKAALEYRKIIGSPKKLRQKDLQELRYSLQDFGREKIMLLAGRDIVPLADEVGLAYTRVSARALRPLLLDWVFEAEATSEDELSRGNRYESLRAETPGDEDSSLESNAVRAEAKGKDRVKGKSKTKAKAKARATPSIDSVSDEMARLKLASDSQQASLVSQQATLVEMRAMIELMLENQRPPSVRNKQAEVPADSDHDHLHDLAKEAMDDLGYEERGDKRSVKKNKKQRRKVSFRDTVHKRSNLDVKNSDSSSSDETEEEARQFSVRVPKWVATEISAYQSRKPKPVRLHSHLGQEYITPEIIEATETSFRRRAQDVGFDVKSSRAQEAATIAKIIDLLLVNRNLDALEIATRRFQALITRETDGHWTVAGEIESRMAESSKSGCPPVVKKHALTMARLRNAQLRKRGEG
jgi:hypothetical protein